MTPEVMGCWSIGVMEKNLQKYSGSYTLFKKQIVFNTLMSRAKVITTALDRPQYIHNSVYDIQHSNAPVLQQSGTLL